MKLWFWRKSPPLPEWAAKLSAEERKILARNLRALVDPKAAIEESIKNGPEMRSRGPRRARRQLQQSGPLN
jgi:hypothetical protein